MKFVFFFYCLDQKSFCLFWEKKNFKIFFSSSNFLFGDCSLMYSIRKVSANYKKDKFLWSLCFFENEALPQVRRTGRNLPRKKNWTPKNTRDQQNCVASRKSQKVTNYPTLLSGPDTALECLFALIVRVCTYSVHIVHSKTCEHILYILYSTQ